MPNVAVKPELLRWAITRSGLPTEELRTKFPKLDEWTRGERQPTFRQLEQFARTTMTPFGAMFLEKPPKEELPVPDFRTRNDAPLRRYSPNLLDTIQTMQRRQAWMREWLIDQGTEPLDYVGAATTAPTSNRWLSEFGSGSTSTRNGPNAFLIGKMHSRHFDARLSVLESSFSVMALSDSITTARSIRRSSVALCCAILLPP